RPDFTAFAGRARRARRKAYRRHNAELFQTAGALVRARMHTCPLGPQTDLLSRLVSTPDPETGEFLDAETIRDQILMHLSNGFNGPSITAAWLAYVLATNPDVEEKLIAEIDGITGGDPGYDLRYDDLMALPYTTAVIKETMRIYPPMPVTIRRSLKDGTLGRYRIRKGDIILVGTLAAQRDPRYWGPFPDRFDPEQFAMAKVAGRPRHAFIPFSIGKRQCMAQEVTFMMLRVVVFEICRKFQLRLAPGATVTKNTVVTTKPATVPVVLLPRPRRADGRRPAPALVNLPGPTAAALEVRQQLRREQRTGRALRRAERLLRLFQRRHYAERPYGFATTDRALAPGGDDFHLHLEPAVERGRVQVVAGAHRTRQHHVAELPVPGLGDGQHPVERVPRVPALRARQAVRARCHPARRNGLRRRGFARVGAPARGLAEQGLARPAGPVRGAADQGRGRGGGRRGRTDRHRFAHGDAAVALRRRRRAPARLARDQHYLDHAGYVVR